MIALNENVILLRCSKKLRPWEHFPKPQPLLDSYMKLFPETGN